MRITARVVARAVTIAAAGWTSAAQARAEVLAARSEASNQIAIIRLDAGVPGLREAADPQFARFQRSITFRSRDPRPYNLVELGNRSFPGRADTGELLSFTGRQWETSESIAARPAPVDPSWLPRTTDVSQSCAPRIEAFAPRYLHSTLQSGVNVGIWDSTSGERQTLVVAFAASRDCPGATTAAPPYRILLAGPVRWRLAALHINIDSPPSLIVVSEAQVGEPITWAIYDLQRSAVRFRERRRGR